MQAIKIQLVKPPQEVVDTTRRLLAEIRAGNLSGIEIENGQVVESQTEQYETVADLVSSKTAGFSVSGW